MKAGEMPQWVTCFTSVENLNLDSQQLYTDCVTLSILGGGVGKRQILGDYVPASLAKTVSSSRNPVSKIR